MGFWSEWVSRTNTLLDAVLRPRRSVIEGERVVTTGDDGRFPRGLPVAGWFWELVKALDPFGRRT